MWGFKEPKPDYRELAKNGGYQRRIGPYWFHMLALALLSIALNQNIRALGPSRPGIRASPRLRCPTTSAHAMLVSPWTAVHRTARFARNARRCSRETAYRRDREIA